MKYALIVMINVFGVQQPADWHRLSVGTLFDRERDCDALAQDVMELVTKANVPAHLIAGIYSCFPVPPTKDGSGRYALTTTDGKLFGYFATELSRDVHILAAEIPLIPIDAKSASCSRV
jgi:hypothetical protein